MGGSDAIHLSGVLREGVNVHAVADGDVVVDSNNNYSAADPGAARGATGGAGHKQQRNYVYVRSEGNTFIVNPIDGDICDVVELHDESYVNALVKRSKTPNDSAISKIAQPVKCSQPLKLVYQSEANPDDRFFYSGDFSTLKHVGGGSCMVVSRGGCRRISLDSRKTVVGRSVDDGTFKEVMKEAVKTGEAEDTYAELFAIATESRDPRKVVSVMFDNTNGPSVKDGQVQFSYVASGAWKFVSRCLRPVWFKAVAAVTPEKKRGKDGKAVGGGKVKVLISGADLDRVRAPLHAMQNLLKTFFLPAVSTAPSSFTTATSKSSTATVPVPNTSDGLLTRTMVFYNKANGNNEGSAKEGDQNNNNQTNDGAAKAKEEQEIHDRVKKVLGGITSFTRDGTNNPNSFEADKLAGALSSQCYLYFSAGDRLSYEGFKLCSSTAAASVDRAGVLLRKAARFWTSPSVVCSTGGSFDRACDALFDVRAISGIVDVVIATAANFGGTVKGSNCEDDEVAGTNTNHLFEWEHGIYVNGGGDGTPAEARKKCYDVLLGKLHGLIEGKEFDAADDMMSNAICSE
ncbi:hypothetical protein TrRE_jg4285, partial [Triparma retinervis]